MATVSRTVRDFARKRSQRSHSFPNNFALLGRGILGVNEPLRHRSGTEVYNAGTQAAINDGNPATRVDSYRNTGETAASSDSLDDLLDDTVQTIELTMATFFDGAGSVATTSARVPAGFSRPPRIWLNQASKSPPTGVSPGPW